MMASGLTLLFALLLLPLCLTAGPALAESSTLRDDTGDMWTVREGATTGDPAPAARIGDIVDIGELREQFDHARSLHFTNTELHYLRGTNEYQQRMFDEGYLEFLRALRTICDAHGIVLIIDEIQTGFARTGRMFAIEHTGIEPDLMTMAKSLAGGFPLAAVVGKSAIMDAPLQGGLGGTYAGSPIACAAARPRSRIR